MAMTETLAPVTTLLDAQKVQHAFPKAGGGQLVVLDDVDLTLREGEIVGLLGRSGSGKSTLLRIIAGLITPSAGKVFWKGTPVTGPADGIAMVFQTFALSLGSPYWRTPRSGSRRKVCRRPKCASARLPRST